MSQSSEDPIAPFAAAICKHMNEDHADTLPVYCVAYAGVQITSGTMTNIDSRGFDIEAEQGGESRTIRIEFPRPVTTRTEVREMIVEMLHQAESKS